jgi:tRNA pseudouridine synthase 10
VRYGETVEGFVAAPLVARAGGTGSRIHCAGREDIDATMLGSGRPFVLEILAPVRREFSLEGIASEVARISSGRVEVAGLGLADREAARRVKQLRLDKTYRARVRVEGEIRDPGRLGRLAGASIRQRTPSRVTHRRKDLERIRGVRSFAVEVRDPGELVLRIRAEAGTYIKELISGDSGRTSPSVAEILGQACRCTRLDVLEVHGSGVEGSCAWVSAESEI